jgi:hypothetical protein
VPEECGYCRRLWHRFWKELIIFHPFGCTRNLVTAAWWTVPEECGYCRRLWHRFGKKLIIFRSFPSIDMCRMRLYLAVPRSFFPSCYIPFLSILFHQLVFHCPSLHLAIYFLVCLSVLFFSIFIYNIFWGEFYFRPILCTWPNQRNLFNLIVSVIVVIFRR